ncbi:MAG: Lpg1974 family pore-forming outer membrane protein [Simkaniaceae bacterium]|nr:Lpg1974 family pore-forming outer membrane protein [Simkaniaceae bacterium]
MIEGGSNKRPPFHMKQSTLLALLLSFSALFADSPADSGAVSGLQPDPRRLTVTPSSLPKKEEDPFAKRDPHFVLNGEWLLWTIQEGMLDYAVRPPDPSGPLGRARIARTGFDWDPGYRLSFGYYRAQSFWEMLGSYTFLRVRGDSATVDSSSSVRFGYHHTDLLGSCIFYPSVETRLKLSLSGGPEFAFMNQQHYVGGGLPSEDRKRSWRYWGGGFRAGTGFEWYWGHGLYVSGLFSTGLVIGHYRNISRQQSPTLSVEYDDYRVAHSLRFLVGPSFRKNAGMIAFALSAGYEMTLWGNLQEVRPFEDSKEKREAPLPQNRGLLLMHGLSLRATLAF